MHVHKCKNGQLLRGIISLLSPDGVAPSRMVGG